MHTDCLLEASRYQEEYKHGCSTKIYRSCLCAGYRLREAELMFQDGQADKSDRVMRGVVRKNPNYAGQSADLKLP